MIEIIITICCAISCFCLSFLFLDHLPEKKETYNQAKKEYERYFGEYNHTRIERLVKALQTFILLLRLYIV